MPSLSSSYGCLRPVNKEAMRRIILVMRPRHSGLWCQALRINRARRQRMLALILIPALAEIASATSGLRMDWCLPTMASTVRLCNFRSELQFDRRGLYAGEANGVALADHKPAALRGWYGEPRYAVHDEGCVVRALVEGGP